MQGRQAAHRQRTDSERSARRQRRKRTDDRQICGQTVAQEQGTERRQEERWYREGRRGRGTKGRGKREGPEEEDSRECTSEWQFLLRISASVSQSQTHLKLEA